MVKSISILIGHIYLSDDKLNNIFKYTCAQGSFSLLNSEHNYGLWNTCTYQIPEILKCSDTD